MVIEVFPPDKRKRDIANVEKAVNDALQAAQVFHDDEQIDDLRIVRRNPVKQGKVLITIASMSDEAIDKRRAKLQSLLQMLTEEELRTLAEQTGIIGGVKALDTMRKNLDEIGLVDCEIIESFLLAKFTGLVERIIQNEK